MEVGDRRFGMIDYEGVINKCARGHSTVRQDALVSIYGYLGLPWII